MEGASKSMFILLAVAKCYGGLNRILSEQERKYRFLFCSVKIS